jgi:hypothetical protein
MNYVKALDKGSETDKVAIPKRSGMVNYGARVMRTVATKRTVVPAKRVATKKATVSKAELAAEKAAKKKAADFQARSFKAWETRRANLLAKGLIDANGVPSRKEKKRRRLQALQSWETRRATA